ncbi:mitochondrial NADH-cytochrome b5 reductase [Aspergillus germanicus]
MSALLNQRTVARAVTIITVGGISTYALSSFFGQSALAESPASQRVFGKGPAFKYLQLHSSESVNHNTKRLRFELPGGGSAQSGLGLTSALLTFSKPEGSWLPAVRPYTPISKLDEPGFIELLVKKYPNGKASTHLHNLKPGDSLLFLASIPGFSWTPNEFSHVYLIAGGAGITPTYQLAQGILDNPADKTKVTVVFGVNTEEDLLLRSEFDAYKQQYPDRFDIHYTVSRPKKDFSPEEGVRSGYVTKELLAELMQGPSEKDSKVFVCGPPAMETALMGGGSGPFGKGGTGILEQLGYTKDRVHRF